MKGFGWVVLAACLCGLVWGMNYYATWGERSLRAAERACLTSVNGPQGYCVHYRADGTSVPVRP